MAMCCCSRRSGRPLNKDAPHRAIVSIKWMNHELRPDGSCEAVADAQDSKLIVFDDIDYDSVQQRINLFMEKVENARKETQPK